MREIKFLVIAATLKVSESVFIVGNDEQLGNWNPSLIKLEKLNDSTWSKIFWFEADKSLEYKFTKGGWENEALSNDGSIPENSGLIVVNDTVVITEINKWKTIEQRKNFGQITGTVEYHLQFEGNGLRPRDIIVWLPPSYFIDINKRYPVLYMHDGQNIIDPATSAFGYDWRIDEVADSLIRIGLLEEIIIIGIYNNADRKDEYNYTSLGYTYMDFIVKKLKPFIDNKYRTLPQPENTAVGGSSAGGLISMIMVWNYPTVFSKAACFSPALKIREINYVDSIACYSGTKKNIKLYIDNGGVGIDAELLPGTNEMVATLQKKGYELGKDIMWYFDKEATHFESAWAKRVWHPLLFFFGKD
jgi:predicted alpha/beta superfamily hydrolase